MKKKVTIFDVAKTLGVSPGTVSNALNNRKGMVSPERQKQIIETAKNMGYNWKRKTNVIRLVFFQEDVALQENNAFFGELIKAIKKECGIKGYTLTMNHLKAKDWKQGIQAFDNPFECDGILILATMLKEEYLYVFERLTLPYVLLDVSYTDQRNNYVAINNKDATYEMTRMLIKTGFTKLGFVNTTHYLHNMRERKAGYLSALHDHGIEHEALYDLRINLGDPVSLRETEKRLLRLRNTKRGLPEVYVCANDYLAIELKGILERNNLPCHVTGFDNIEASEKAGITTNMVDKNDFGKAGVRRLADLIEDPRQTPQRVLVGTHIIVRGEFLKI